MCLTISFRFSMLVHYSPYPYWCPYYVGITQLRSTIEMAKGESFSLALSQECFVLFACGNSGLMIRYECWDQFSNFWGGEGIWVLKGLAPESVDHLQVYCHLTLLSLSAWTQGSLLLGLLSSLLTMVYNYSVCKPSSSFVTFIPILLFSIWFQVEFVF